MIFNLTLWDEGDITVDGSFTLIIEEIDSTGELMYYITTDFEIDEEDADDGLEVDDEITTGAVGFMWFIFLVWSEDSFDDFKDELNDVVENQDDFLDTTYGDNNSIVYSIEELEYGMKYSVEDTELETSEYLKMLWDEKGILKHWEMTSIEDEEKSGILIKKKGFNILEIIQSIPGYPMELFLAIFAISTLGIIILSKKHK